MFHNNPFLGAAEQFSDAAVLLFAATESILSQRTNGYTSVDVVLAPSLPFATATPSPYGVMAVEFNYNTGDAALLRTARELEEDIYGIEEEATLGVTRTYTVGASKDDDAEDVIEQLWERASTVHIYGEDAGLSIDRVIRRHGEYEHPMLAAEIAVIICEAYTVAEVHSRNWELFAQECAELVADFAEIATGARPQLDLGPLTAE